jgi:hypothetical protein
MDFGLRYAAATFVAAADIGPRAFRRTLARNHTTGNRDGLSGALSDKIE